VARVAQTSALPSPSYRSVGLGFIVRFVGLILEVADIVFVALEAARQGTLGREFDDVQFPRLHGTDGCDSDGR
jgi:hypothetical protein